MKKSLFITITTAILSLLFPLLTFAANNSSLSFTPPVTDYSVIFLGNIFGVVDGVLHGTGSQIMGVMFGVFNSAVLAVGGIIIMYTLLVSTMNTAHEGEMLGRKWSSIWVPLRSTLGLALLIPKASGYCVMQIFVMWIVVQGVGAADKIWNAALSYLNTGGTIVQKQLSPINELMMMGGEAEIVAGASKILAGQVCMVAVQAVLTQTRQRYLEAKQTNGSECAGSPSPDMKQFCETPVPDFLSSVNTGIKRSPLPMPNFPPGSAYTSLNGICGSIKWNPFTRVNNLKNIKLSDSEKMLTLQTRDVAVQQLYNSLSPIAQQMVSNDPIININLSVIKGIKKPANGLQQFGIPLNGKNQLCSIDDKDCVGWGVDPKFETPPLFQGREFQDAISTYNATMRQSLSLLVEDQNQENAQKSREFIKGAKEQGWLMAGSYFFKLALLNSGNSEVGDTTDNESGLQETDFQNYIATAFDNKQCVGEFKKLCIWVKQDSSQLSTIIDLINGKNSVGTPLEFPKASPLPGTSVFQPYSGEASSTLIGYVNNSMMLKAPGQPGQTPPKFQFKMNIDYSPLFPLMDEKPYKGHICFPWPADDICLDGIIFNVFYNMLLRSLVNNIITGITLLVQTLVSTVILLPLMALSTVFTTGVEIIQRPNINPIIGLAKMGIYYINVSVKIWILSVISTITTIIWPWVGLIVGPIMLLGGPIFFAWVGVMLSVGFITAYYVPFVPYMIFTFASIAWLMAVIEAMVAAPIVALGVTHPEGEGAFGKGEQAIMILFNVFLRPGMMIIGYIAAIAMTYVSVWIINAGFSNVLVFLQGTSTDTFSTFNMADTSKAKPEASHIGLSADYISDEHGYIGWAGAFGFFFSILIYTSMYLTVVQKSFTLITNLPDRVLRWIGGGTEQIGGEVASWGEETKGQVGKAGEATSTAQAQQQGKLGGMAASQAMKLRDAAAQGGNIQGQAGQPPGQNPAGQQPGGQPPGGNNAGGNNAGGNDGGQQQPAGGGDGGGGGQQQPPGGGGGNDNGGNR